MGNTFDLQIQSTASDGKHAPAEIVAMARDLGIRVIALTDHDTVVGVAEALATGAEQGVRVIPGIEISVEERGAHILGYGIDIHNADLLRALEESKQGRIAGARQMVENLRVAGFAIEWEDVARQATGDVVARPHLARAVLGRPENRAMLGDIATSHDFIERYLTDESPYYVRRAHIIARDAIALIHGAGGVAVWSHPAVHFHPVRSKSPKATAAAPEAQRTSNGVRGNYEELEKFLNNLIGWGIDGLEAFNPSHTEDDAEFLQGLAVKYRLLRTAGSDFHEAGNHPSDPESGLHSARTLGDFQTYGFTAEGIVEALDAAIARHKEAVQPPV